VGGEWVIGIVKVGAWVEAVTELLHDRFDRGDFYVNS
jgi:hypothetical protein